MTVGVPSANGTAWTWEASTDRPRNMKPSVTPMTTRVDRALRHAGSLKAGTPLGDGLDAGHRRATGGEGVQDDEQGRPVEHAAPGRTGMQHAFLAECLLR